MNKPRRLTTFGLRFSPRPRPLRAPPTLGHHLGGQLGRPGARADDHTPGC